ncbi:T9SS type A sorting domain-containing protein [Lentimicrobium sp.]|uniref:T9SS type A sorting domain-containing protein n=1 Tax=Lentimicrobium sp. TaxID=2034841 RepID=UPI002CCBB740|nr:T9SS type A sorting domain-containing protein [Lentimicrobium sp.]HRW69231.1 T9SS type A sorting domain-containing protein [Lentimicrobium sp.]
MKHKRFVYFLTLSVILIVNSYMLVGQNFKVVNTDGVTYLKASAGPEIIAIRIDSVAQNGDQTEYYNIRQMRETNSGCWITNGASWLGDKVTEYPDGKTQFIFYPFSPGDSNDVFTIFSQAGTGDSWPFYYAHVSNTYSYVEATVDHTEETELNGLTDTVKFIVLYCRDAAGNIVDNPVNGQEIMLSRNNGLLSIPKLDEFRNHPEFYTFIGKVNPEVGSVLPGTLEIFDFQPEDEFHTLAYYKTLPPYSRIETHQEIKRYLTRYDSPSGDTVTYTYERCYSTHVEYMGSHNYWSRIDTVTEKIIPALKPYLEKEPLESFQHNSGPGWGDSWSYNTGEHTLEYGYLPEGLTGKVFADWNSWEPSFFDPDCLQSILIDLGCYYYEHYYRGLGGPYHDCWDFWSSSYHKLRYYKKGDISWGLPLSCDSLLLVGVAGHELPRTPKVYPNPATSYVTLSLASGNQLPAEFRLYDNTGRLVLVRQHRHPEETINIELLAPGCYYYRWISSSGNAAAGKLIRQ